MIDQLERPEAPSATRRPPALEIQEDVFPRWLTLFVVVAWMAVMAWAVTFSTITFS